MINNTPLYIDLLDYLERDGIASLSNDFDPNAFMTNFDELDTTSPLINNPTVAPTMPYIIPPLGGGDGPRQGLESLREEDDDDVFDYEYDAYGIVDPFSMGVKGSTIHEIGLAAAEKERERLREVAKIQAELDKVKTSEGDRNMGKDKDKDKDKDKKSKGYSYVDTPGGGKSQGDRDSSGKGGAWGSSATGGGWCFDPSTPIQMADGSEKKIKEIQLGDNTKGGEVTGVFQFKAADEIHDYKGVTVAGSHFVKEDGKFIMVKDSPLAVKIDKIPVVYSLDTSGRRIFIKDIEFADYNGDGVAKNFLTNAGVNLSGFDKEVLRQVENRLI